MAEIVKDIKAGSQESTVPGAELFNSLPDELTDIYKGDFRRKLGKALSSRVGSLFDDSGLHLEKGEVDRRNGTTYWKVADVRISRIAIPQKEDFLKTNYPPQGLSGEGRGISDQNIFPSGEENQSAKSAHPQTSEGGEPWKA